MTIDIAAIPPATPPAVVLVFELCPPIGIGVTEFEKEPRESLLVEYDKELEVGVEGWALVGPLRPTRRGKQGQVSCQDLGVAYKKTGVRQQPGERGRWRKLGRKFLSPTAIALAAFQVLSDWDVL
jgi:hypothetical protein